MFSFIDAYSVPVGGFLTPSTLVAHLVILSSPFSFIGDSLVHL